MLPSDSILGRLNTVFKNVQVAIPCFLSTLLHTGIVLLSILLSILLHTGIVLLSILLYTGIVLLSSWTMLMVASLLLAFQAMPVATATLVLDDFPDIPFVVFSEWVETHFNPKVTLATVLTVLFSLTENTDLLNLHSRQQHPQGSRERYTALSGWIKTLSRALQKKLGTDSKTLLQPPQLQVHSEDATTSAIATKLDSMAKVLNLNPYNKHGRFVEKLNTVSLAKIEPAIVICPEALECVTTGCNYAALLMASQKRDISYATLVKGTTVYGRVPVLGGQCPICNTRYFADHEAALQPGQQDGRSKLYLNDAKYLKVGKSFWVDRSFSRAALNGMYSFHASAAAYTDFWNNTFQMETGQPIVARRLIWQTFIQESIRQIAKKVDISLVLDKTLDINMVAQEAFKALGDGGKIRSADGHFCTECTHPFKRTADFLTEDDPAAIVGIDENRVVPGLIGEGADLALQDAAQARRAAREAARAELQLGADDNMDVDTPVSVVNMVVMDGIVMGHAVSYFS